jgi:N-methylhydantoinase A
MAGEGDARLGVDIGGTFTDVVLESAGRRHTVKVLTTRAAPERAVMEGVSAVLAKAGARLSEVSLVIHGTTLAANALIERKGAKTALVTTEGFRDSVEMGSESRFEQYDIFMERPQPLVPRRLRFPVRERLSAKGEVLVPLDPGQVEALVPALEREGVESVAVGFLHAFVNPVHELKARDLLAKRLPGLPITLASEVSPEFREYERFSTACANAYVQPPIARYLKGLERELGAAGFEGALFLMLSGGGVGTLETAVRFPIRIVDSGPAGGAIFAGRVAAERGLARVLSFDMGGTTAKICLVDDGKAQAARRFEVARVYRFLKGSGLPVRVPVIDMVEIGAGGGSIARVDALRRIAVGPDSAGAEPGPACYGRGGRAATVTDADLAMGRIDPDAFSGGRLPLDPGAAAAALAASVGAPLGLAVEMAALGVGEIVDENMANAARVHAIESGKTLDERTLVAFGGAAPLHAARIAEKLGISRVVVPKNAGVGSAVGFLEAPVAYETVRSLYQRLSSLELARVNAALAEMQAAARAVVAAGAPGAPVAERRLAYMRYVGQGHEIPVPIPARALVAGDLESVRRSFEETYGALYGRPIPGVDVEILSFQVAAAAEGGRGLAPAPPEPAPYAPEPAARRPVLEPGRGRFLTVPVHWRDDLRPGARVPGPAIVAEAETSTVVTPAFDAAVDAFGAIVLERKRTN